MSYYKKIKFVNFVFNRTIEDICKYYKLNFAKIRFSSLTKFEDVIDNNYHDKNETLFSFYLTNSAPNTYYTYLRGSRTITEKNGTVIQSSKIACLNKSFLALEVAGTIIGCLLGIVLLYYFIKFLIQRRNINVS